MVTVLLSLSDAYTWISHVKIQPSVCNNVTLDYVSQLFLKAKVRLVAQPLWREPRICLHAPSLHTPQEVEVRKESWGSKLSH